MNTTTRLKTMFKIIMLPLFACGMMCVTGAYAQSGDIIGFYSEKPNTTYTAPGAKVEFTIRFYGTIVVSNLFNTPVTRPEIRMEVGSDGAIAKAAYVRSTWTAEPFDVLNRTDMTFEYVVGPGDMADPLKIFGTPSSGFTVYDNQTWIYKAYSNGSWSNVTWKVDNNLFNQPGDNGLDTGVVTQGDIDLSAQNIRIRTLSFDNLNSPATIIARQPATLWRITSGATNAVPVNVVVWTPHTNVLQIGSMPNQALEVTIPAGSDYADFAVKGLNTNAIPTLATVYAQRPSDYAKNGTAVMNFLSRQVTIEPPGPPTLYIEFLNGLTTQTLPETNTLETGSFRIVLSEPHTSRVYVDFSVAHQPSTITNIVITPSPDGYYVNAGQDKSGWHTFSAVNGTKESSQSPYVQIMPIATNTTKYAFSSPGILNLANLAPSVQWAFAPTTGDENTPVTFEWESLMDVAADMARGITFKWNFGDGARITQTKYTDLGQITHTYTGLGGTPRAFTLTLTITDADGGTYTMPPHTILVSPAPIPANVAVEVNRADATYSEGDTTAKYRVVLSQPALQDTAIELKGLYVVGGTSSDGVLGLTVTNNIVIPKDFTNSVWFTMNIIDGTANSANGIRIVPTITNAASQAQYPGAYPGVLYIQNIAPAIDTVPTFQPTTSALPPYNAIELNKPFGFRYKATDIIADVNGTPPISVQFQFEDGTTKTSIGANGTITNTFTALGAQTVTMVATDKDGGERTVSFPILVVPPLPPPSVTVVDYPVFIPENDTSSKPLTIVLSRTPISVGITDPVVVYLDVTPINSALDGAVTIPASVLFATNEATKQVNFTVQDGTRLSATGGFTVTPRIVAGQPGATLYQQLQPGQILVQNIAAVFQQPVDGSANTTATTKLPHTFTWSIRDVTADLATMNLFWDWGDGTTSTTTGGSGTTNHTYNTASAQVSVTVRATDKDGDTSIISFYVTVKDFGVGPNPSAIFISFDAQGGSNPVPFESYWLFNGMTYQVLSSTARAGYTFGGWWTSPNGGGTQIFEESIVNVTDPSKAQTLYAKWIGNSYALNFDGYEAFSQIVTNGFLYGALPAPNSPAHYSFDGWYTGGDGSGVKITSNTLVNILSDQTLYVHWRGENVTVNLDAQGGSIGMSSTNLEYGSVYGTLTVPSLGSIKFDGWWTSLNGEGLRVFSNSMVTATTEHTLFAKWNFNDILGTSQVTWKNGDTYYWQGTTNVVKTRPVSLRSGAIGDSQSSWLEATFIGPCTYKFWWTVSSEESCDFLSYAVDQIEQTSISGYNIANQGQSIGWTQQQLTLPAGEHTIRWTYHKDDSVSMGSDCGWLANMEYTPIVTVSFNAQGGVASTNEKTVLGFSPYGTLPTATKTGYTLARWETSEGQQIMSNTVVTIITNHTLFARWTTNQYVVTFNGQGATPSPVSKTVSYDAPYGGLSTVAKTGYTFDGWFTVTNGNGQQVLSETTVSVPSNHTVYAKWVPNTYYVTFNPQNGAVDPLNVAVTYGTPYGILPIPTRTGYLFGGWFTQISGGGTRIENETVVAITIDQTLYAKWTPQSFTLTFDGQGATPSPLSKSITYDAPYGTLATASKTGYSFMGWFTQSLGGGHQITNATVVTVAGNQTLFASWTPNTYTIIFDGQGGDVAPTNKTVTYGTGYGELPLSVLADAVMDSWWTQPNGKGQKITAETNVSITATQTLYAKWDINSVLGTTGLVWSTDGSGGIFWKPQAGVKPVGHSLAMQSGSITNTQNTWIETTVNGPGVFSFDWAVSAEVNRDIMTCMTNGTLFKTLTSKTLNWTNETVTVGRGPCTFRWTFSKDISGSVGSNTAWLAACKWTPQILGFTGWALSLGMEGDAASLFEQDRNVDGIPNGFEYAFGTNLPLTELMLNIRFVNGHIVVDIPKQDEATLPFVSVVLKGSTNLVDWTLHSIPAIDTTGKPVNREWRELLGNPEKAFFKLNAELKE